MLELLIIGRLGADPEKRYNSKGESMWSVSIATNKKMNNTDVTTWVRGYAHGNHYDNMMQYFKKGSLILVRGDLITEESGKQRIYTDKDGRPQASIEMRITSVKFVPGAGQGQGQGPSQGYGSTSQYGAQGYAPPQQQQPSSSYGFGGSDSGGYGYEQPDSSSGNSGGYGSYGGTGHDQPDSSSSSSGFGNYGSNNQQQQHNAEQQPATTNSGYGFGSTTTAPPPPSFTAGQTFGSNSTKESDDVPF